MNEQGQEADVKSPRRSGYVFISYKSEEAKEAAEIQAFLEREGYPCWRAPDSLHQTGTQDYSTEILGAIRGAKCLLLLLSNKALGSHWVRREVKFAMEMFDIPVIPYVVSPVSQSKKEHDAVYLGISLEKQILNEDLRNDKRVMLPYLEKAFQGGGFQLEENRNFGLVRTADVQCSAGYYRLARARADESIDRIAHLSNARECIEDAYLTPSIRRRSLGDALDMALSALIDLLVLTPPEGSDEFQKMKDMRAVAVADLAKLVYDHDKWVGKEIFDRVEPYAEDGVPWANFVLHPRYYYPPDSCGEAALEHAFKVLERSVSDGQNPYAMVRFGECFLWGIGTRISAAKALFWFRRAADLGCAKAYVKAARVYGEGWSDVELDTEKSKALYRKGVAAGDPEAMRRLGDSLDSDVLYAEFGCLAVDDLEALRKESEDLMVQSYEAGSLDGLAAFVGLKHNAYRCFDSDYAYSYATKEHEELYRRTWQKLGEIGNARWIATLARILKGEGQIEAAMDYALHGLSEKGADCAQVMAEIALELARKDIEQSVDTADGIRRLPLDAQGLVAFLEIELKTGHGEKVRYICDAMANYREKAPDDQYDIGGVSDVAIASPFWCSLTSGTEYPSALSHLSIYSPMRFLYAVESYGGEPGSRLESVVRVWKLMRVLDYERCDALSIQEHRYGMIMPGRNLSATARLERVMGTLRSIAQADMGLFADVDAIIASRTTGQAGNLPPGELRLDREIVEIIDAFSRKVVQYANAHPDSVIRYAKMLADEQFKKSHPLLELALHYARLSHDWGSSTGAAQLYANLFLAANARYREVDRNAATLYRVVDALVKTVYMNSLAAFPLLFEACLFGLEADDARVEPDYRLFRELADVIEPEIARISRCDAKVSARRDTVALDYEREAATRVAYAFGKAFADANLHIDGQSERGWGTSSLYFIDKSSVWLSYAHRCASANDGGEERDLIEKDTREILMVRNRKGYRVDLETADLLSQVQTASHEGESDHGVEASSDSVGRERYTRKADLGRVETILEGIGGEVNVFPHVLLGDTMCDFVASTDVTAVLILVLPPWPDLAVEPPHGEMEAAKNTLSCLRGKVFEAERALGLLDTLSKTLKDLEPDAEIRSAIVASVETASALRTAYEGELEKRALLVCSYDDLAATVRSCFGIVDSES